MFWLPFKSVHGKLRLTTNCSGAVATVALTAVIFGTLLILKFAAPLPGPHKGRVREFFIAAEEHTWDYTPLSRDPMTGAWWNGSIVSTKANRNSAAITPANLYYLDQDLRRSLCVRCIQWLRLIVLPQSSPCNLALVASEPSTARLATWSTRQRSSRSPSAAPPRRRTLVSWGRSFALRSETSSGFISATGVRSPLRCTRTRYSTCAETRACR